jgi:DNA repair exonuclease SbcCD ATPase subunit
MIPSDSTIAASKAYHQANAQCNNEHENLVNRYKELSERCDKLLASSQEHQKLNENLDSRNRSLAAENRRLSSELESIKHERRNEVSRFQEQIDSYRNKNRDLILERETLSSSVSELRSHMYAKGMAHSPRQPDSYYVEKFESLNGLLEQKLLDFSEDHSGQPLSEDRAHIFLRYLKVNLGPQGQKTYDVLTKRTSKYSFQTFYNDDHLRDLLLRHITALHLFHHVFKPFAAGISPEISEIFSSILEDEKNRGL